MSSPSASVPARLPELTIRAVVLALLLSVVMGAANVYLGLKAGMTVSASIPAAVVGMLILKMLSKQRTVLEANLVQTGASAGESLAAGIIFTMPALLLVGAWKEFDWLMTTVVAFTGGLLGILFMIPMRRVFVLGSKELQYPEGVACAAVLEAGDGEAEGGGGAMQVVYGGAIGGVFKLLISFVGLMSGTLEGATALGQRILYFGGDVSPALIGVGFIVRLNVAALIFIGGAIAWLVGIPLLGGADAHPEALEGAWALWSTKIRYVGVGAMVVGGISSIVKVRHGLLQAVVEIRKRLGSSAAEVEEEGDRDISSKVIVGLSMLATLLVGGVYYSLTGKLGITLVTTAIMLVMSFFFTAVASYIVGLVGNSNSPVSGMTITAVLFSCVMLWMFGFVGEDGMFATLGVAAIVCCAACTSGDVCNDLKTGSIVGASPRNQQILQILGVLVASLVMAPVLQLLHENTPGGIGGRELSAPQANLFASLVRGFFGSEGLPWDMVGAGAAVGVVILIVDRVLEARGSKFRAHLMPIAVGMYLPFGLATPILIGGLIAHFVGKGAKDEAEEEKRHGPGILFSSGIIAGESLMGVGIALLSAAGVARLQLGLAPALVTTVTAVGAAAMVALFVALTRPRAG
jgi:putative OPT family oligopeptide transporter